MDINELESFRLSDAIKFNTRLNPKLWGRDERLLPEVKKQLLQIAEDFREFLGVNDIEIKDITISGSNAAYTYTSHSDIDLHLVVDLPKADSDEVYRELFDAKKYVYNDQHNYKIGDYDVELYVQDANKPHYSQGIYSIVNDAWISVPNRRRPSIDDISVKSKYEDMGARIEAALRSDNINKMDALADKIKLMRQAGLETTGEFGPENLTFKLLRNHGLLDRLRIQRLAAKDREMSLSERRKKKSSKTRRRYGYGGWFYPGYHNNSGSESTADGGGGGESVHESKETDSEIIQRFAASCARHLELENPPVIKLRRDPEWTRRHGTFGRYTADPHNQIELATSGRHIIDILRTLAHEMTHAAQNEQMGLPDHAGETGSEFEDGANAMAGRIMRHWAENEPEMFRGVDLDEDWRRTAGAAAAAACIAGTPGCATTGTTGADVLRTIQDVGRTAQTMRGYGRAEAEAELRQRVKDALRRQRGEVTPESVAESSGYIPTEKERNDPRFKMALTVDVHPGETGRQANKLGLDTDSQGRPALLMKKLNNLLEQVKLDEDCWQGYRQAGMKKKGDRMVPNCVPVADEAVTPVAPAAPAQSRPAQPVWPRKKGQQPDGGQFRDALRRAVAEDEELTEVDMSPGALKRWARSEAAQRVRVGFEFEMYFPNTSSDPDDSDDEPYDYDYDRQAGSIADVIDFFSEGNNPSPRGMLNRLEAQMYDQYYDWRQEMIDEEMTENGFFEYMDESDDAEEIRTDKQAEFRLEAEEKLGDDADRDEITDRAQEMWIDWVDTQWNRGDSVYMENYRDYVSEALDENFSEEAWLQSEYRYMSDVANEWSLDWPHLNERYREGGGTDPETWADQLSQVIGMPVKTGGYHSTRRGEDHANLEYDSSLDDPNDSEDAGLELITPYRPLPEALQILDRVIEFADQNGIYTNKSTGLHMNVSLEGVKNVDWVKLVLFMGDTYILDTFERRANTYARSSMMKLMDKIRERRAQEPVQEQDQDRAIYAGEIDIDRAMRLMRDNMIELARQAVQSGLGRDKYQSVHVKELNDGGSYIEFRGPGGDWLGKQDENADVLRNTVFRLGRAMEIAADPEAERKEYAKKLYKALTPEMPQLRSAMQLFAQYNAGDINREQLKREWAEAVLQAERDKISQQRTTGGSYKIVDRNSGEVLDRYEAGSDSEALEYAMNHWAGRGINYDIKREVKDTDPTPKEKRRRELARRVAGKPTWWRVSVIGRPKYTGWIQAPTAARAIQDFERRMNIEGDFNRTSFDTRVEEPPPLRDEPMPDAVKDLRVRPESWFPRRSNWALVTANGEVDETFAAPDREAAMDRLRSWQNEPNKPDTPRWVVPIDREAPAQSQPTTTTSINQPGEGESHWQVTWDEYRERDGERIRFTDALRVVAASAQEATRRLINSLTAQGRNPFNVTATPTNPPPWSQNRELQGGAPGARIVNDPRSTQGEFTGRWLVRSTVTGETVHTISGIGNVQADANRHAARWAQSTGFDDGIEVVPEMG